jgi:hypothetical protein
VCRFCFIISVAPGRGLDWKESVHASSFCFSLPVNHGCLFPAVRASYTPSSDLCFGVSAVRKWRRLVERHLHRQPGVFVFQFSGRQGDAVTALVSTASLGSGLDSVLYLLNSDGTVFAGNDDNGLFFQSDSFIQAVLPADGTYYLVVTDAQGRGSANGYYRLHVQFLTPTVQGGASKLAGLD